MSYREDTGISRDAKVRFNERLAEKLRGREAQLEGEHERHIYSLLERYAPVRFGFPERNRGRFAAHDGLLGGVRGGFCGN